MQKNQRIILGVLLAIFVLITTAVFFFTWENSEITDKWITGGLLIANLSVALLIYLQIRQSNDHFLDLNRPWINLDLGHSTETTYHFEKPNSQTLYPLFLVNRGNLSARDVEIKFLKSESKINESYLQHIPKNIRFNSIPPNFKHRVFSDVSFYVSNSEYLVYSISYKFKGEIYKINAYITNFDGLAPTCTDKMPIEPSNNP